MSRKQGRRVRMAVCIISVVLFLPGVVMGQNFKPFTKLKTIKTEHFEFIFPPESEETARVLAGMADAAYLRLSELFGITIPGRTAVSITPHTDEINGYMNPVPYSHILVFDTPEFVEFATSENTIENLFLHEFTHALTAASRGQFMKGLYNIFGGWANLLAFNAPWFMIEGAAVAIESETGFGRANDPLVKEKLRQDSFEKAFKTPFQAEGVWDLPPNANVYYNYGGLFCTYLIKTYGQEKFARLWQEIGKTFHFSVIKYNNGFYYIFEKVYGIKILDAWADFENDIKLDGAINAHPPIVYQRKGAKASISDVASGKDGAVFILDRFAEKVFVYNSKTKKTKTAVFVDSAAYALAVSPDGKRLLVSTYKRTGAVTGQLSEAEVVEYSVRTGLRTGRVFKKLYYARYFKDGVIGVAPDTHKTNVVYRPFDKKKPAELLLKGNAELAFGSICPLDENRFAFICSVKGRREIALFDYEQKQVWTFTGAAQDASGYWNHARYLRFAEGRLTFQYNENDRMSKLGEIVFDSQGVPHAVLRREDMSGGVHNPVVALGDVFYKSAFSQTDALSVYPANADAPPPVELRLALKGWDAPRLVEAGLAKASLAAAPDKAGTLDIAGAAMLNWTPYHTVDVLTRYFNPLNLWVPLPYIGANTATGDEFRGLGGFFYISDPFDTNLIFLEAYYDWTNKMLPITLTWINYFFTIPVYFSYTDKVIVSEYLNVRIVRPWIYTYFTFPLFSNRLKLQIQPGISGYYNYYSPYKAVKNGEISSSAYEWEKANKDSYFFNMNVMVTSISVWPWQLFGNGASASLHTISWLSEKDKPCFEGVLTGVMEPLPLLNSFGIKQTLYGTYWESKNLSFTGSPLLTRTSFQNVSLSEYTSSIPRKLEWLLGGETELKLFSLEPQENLSHIYFNRLFASIAYRWGYWGGQLDSPHPDFLHSLVLRIGAHYSVTPVSVLPIKLMPAFWLSLKLSALDKTVNEEPVNFGLSFNYSY